MIVGAEEIMDAILKLDINKTCGDDNFYEKHLKYASTRILPLLTMCFAGFLVHSIMPDTMISVILVPVIKDKTGKITATGI